MTLPADLTALIGHLPAWLLVLFRLTGIFAFAPVLGGNSVPMRVKVMLAIGLSFCVYPALLWPGTASSANMDAMIGNELPFWSMAAMIAMELAIGVVIGLGASLPLIGMQMAGRVMDMQLGLAAAGLFNPDLGEQSGIISEFLFMAAIAMFVVLGGHVVLFQILVGSFNHVPLGGFQVNSTLIDMLIGMMDTVFKLAVRVAAPVLCMMFLISLSMGFIQKTVPQLNILSIGFTLRIMTGVAVLIAGFVLLDELFVESLENVLVRLVTFFESDWRLPG